MYIKQVSFKLCKEYIGVENKSINSDVAQRTLSGNLFRKFDRSYKNENNSFIRLRLHESEMKPRSSEIPHRIFSCLPLLSMRTDRKPLKYK